MHTPHDIIDLKNKSIEADLKFEEAFSEWSATCQHRKKYNDFYFATAIDDTPICKYPDGCPYIRFCSYNNCPLIKIAKNRVESEEVTLLRQELKQLKDKYKRLNNKYHLVKR